MRNLSYLAVFAGAVLLSQTPLFSPARAAGPPTWTGRVAPDLAAPRVPDTLRSKARPLPDDIAGLSRARSPQLSPDGRHVVYTLSTVRRDASKKPSDSDSLGGWTRDQQLYIVSSGGGEPRQLTTDGASPARWSPDGRHLAFIRRKGGHPAIHVLPLDGGEAVAVDTGAYHPHDFRWTPDGQGFVFVATVPRDDDDKAEHWARGGATRFEQDEPISALFEVRRDATEPRRLTHGTPGEKAGKQALGSHIVGFELSPDGQTIAAVVSPSAVSYDVAMRTNIVLVDRKQAKFGVTVTSKPGMVGQLAWSPDSRKLAWTHSPKGLSLMHGLEVYDVRSRTSVEVAEAHDTTIGDIAWSHDGRTILAALADKTRTRLVRFGLDGTITRAPKPLSHVLWQLGAPNLDGLAVAVASNTETAPEIALVNTRTSAVTLLTDANPGVKKHWNLAQAEVIEWQNPAGQTIEGILYTARKGAKPKHDGRLMVLPHGGPDSVSQLYFDTWVHYFVARGYAVLRPNYRGGTGYGFAHYEANRGQLGSIEFADIEAGVDALIARGIAKADRLYYGGWSWGGYLSAWTLGHTNRYKAIMVGAGVVDTAVQYVTSDINHGLATDWEFKSRPVTDPVRFDAQNPVRFLGRASTPTLIIHGQSDSRVPFVNGQILYRALVDVNCPVSFWTYPREPHSFREPAHVAHMLTKWATWFDTH